MGDWLLNLLFPPRCVHCKSFGDWICDKCFAEIVTVSPICSGCGKLSDHFVTCGNCRSRFGVKRLIVFSHWQEPMKSIVYGFKYKRIQVLSKKLGTWLAERLTQNNDSNNEIILVPVPLHLFRLLTRGFNQAELLGRQIEKTLGLKLVPALKRKKATAPQFGLTKNLRRGNIEGAFAFNSLYFDLVNNSTVVLVDDIMATGSTISECAKVLKQNGAKSVWALTIAR